MTYEEAMAAVDAGKSVRRPPHGAGWKIKRFFPQYLGCVNPHTGSDYQYVPSDEDRDATDWEIYPA